MKKILVGLIGGILAALGSFLPWGIATILGKTEFLLGIKGAGIFTLVLSIIGAIFLFLAIKFRRAGIGTIITGLLISIISVQQMSMLKEGVGGKIGEIVPGVLEVHIGYGLYLTLIGGIILLIGGIIVAFKKS